MCIYLLHRPVLFYISAYFPPHISHLFICLFIGGEGGRVKKYFPVMPYRIPDIQLTCFWPNVFKTSTFPSKKSTLDINRPGGGEHVPPGSYAPEILSWIFIHLFDLTKSSWGKCNYRFSGRNRTCGLWFRCSTLTIWATAGRVAFFVTAPG